MEGRCPLASVQLIDVEGLKHEGHQELGKTLATIFLEEPVNRSVHRPWDVAKGIVLVE